MALDYLQPVLERAEVLVYGIAAVALLSQGVDLLTNVRARASGATRTEARVRGRDAGMVTLLVAVLLLAVTAAFGWWAP